MKSNILLEAGKDCTNCIEIMKHTKIGLKPKNRDNNSHMLTGTQREMMKMKTKRVTNREN